MSKGDFRRLAERIILGVATDEEIHLYNQVYDSFQAPDSNKWDEELYGNKEALQAAMRSVIHEQAGFKSKSGREMWIRWTAAAAAIICLLVSASYFINRNYNPIPAVARVEAQKDSCANDVAPGRTGAVLTLSNGKTIILDTATNGSLAEEDGTEIFKQDGQITYAHQSAESEALYNKVTTPRGRQFTLVLADGSKVWLNAESSITFPTVFAGEERKVSITGEAYFEIAHKSQKPFIVEKGDMRVQVLGTHFNINSYEDEHSINVTLLEGSLKVSKRNVSSLIKPGQQVQLQKQELKLVNDADINTIMAWRNGLFDFKGKDIGVLMRQLTRWYDVEVVYDAKIDDLFFATIPRNTNLSDVLKALELTGKVKFEIEGKTIHVMR